MYFNTLTAGILSFTSHWRSQSIGFGWALAHNHKFTDGVTAEREARVFWEVRGHDPQEALSCWVPELAFPAL